MKKQDLNKLLIHATLNDLLMLIDSRITEINRTEIQTIQQNKPFVLYDNEGLKKILGVQDKLIKKYRDDGLLPFHKTGDKFWYTQEDVDTFLEHNYFEAYAYTPKEKTK